MLFFYEGKKKFSVTPAALANSPIPGTNLQSLLTVREASGANLMTAQRPSL